MRRPLFLALSREARAPEALVLCLTASVEPGQTDELTGIVLARAAEGGVRGGTVVLALDDAVDADCLAALYSLQERLRELGMCLRLAIRPEERHHLRKDATSRLSIYHTLRSAVLATYAACLGPGLVTAQVRAALSVPAEPLRVRACIYDEERHVKAENLRGPGQRTGR